MKKLLSIAAALALCLSMLSAPGLAAEAKPGTGLCPHHQEHTGECGYIAPSAGASCRHEHTDNCRSEEGVCLHVHDEACGYVPADPGRSCGYVCRICPVQTMLDALPDADGITPENAGETAARLEAIDGARAALTDGEIVQLDFARYEAAASALSALEGQTGADVPEPAVDGAWPGSGAENDPYRIEDLADLELLAANVNSGTEYENTYFTLTADIDMSEKYGAGSGEDGADLSWTPIGIDEKPFRGSFDGGECQITGLYIHAAEDYQGLFGYVGPGGTVKNLTVAGSVTSTGSYTGGVAGYNTGTVSNCQNTGTVKGDLATGGVVGYNTGTVSNCSNAGNISSSGISTRVGGVVGLNSAGSVSNCQNTGGVTGTRAYVGGIAGYNCNGSTVSSCQNTGAVSNSAPVYYSNTRTGGIVGMNTDSTISNCQNAGNVSNTGRESSYNGGVVGRSEGSSSVLKCSNTGNVSSAVSSGGDTGGVAGYNDAVVSNCYNTGKVQGKIYIGGVIGFNGEHGTTSNCHNIGKVTGSQSVGGVIGYDYPNAAIEKLLNCYYAESAYRGGIGDGNSVATAHDTVNAVRKSAETLRSGEVAYLLQGNQTELIWGQSLPAGGTDSYPILISGESGRVYKITFLAEGEEYAARYANPGGTVDLPDAPSDGVYALAKWSLTDSVDGTAFTASTPVTQDMTVYAVAREKFGAEGKELTDTYGYAEALTQNLLECVRYAGGTSAAAGNFTFAFAANGNPLGSNAVINDGMLTIAPGVGAGTYVLNITAAETAPQISMFGARGNITYGTEPVTFPVTVRISKAAPVVAAPTGKANLVYNGAEQVLISAGNTTGGTLQYSLDGINYSTDIPKGTNADAYTVYYKVDGDNNYENTNAESIQVTIGRAVEPIPSITIDYAQETLTGFAQGSGYAVNGAEVAPTAGRLAIADGHFGQTLSIVTKARDRNYTDSPGCSLTVPARDAAPTGLRGEGTSFAGEGDGKITGVTTAMEYRQSAADKWTDAAKAEITGLAAGTYFVRTKATADSFASEAAAVIVDSGPERIYTQAVTTPAAGETTTAPLEGTAPKSGDETAIGMWIALAVVCAGGLCAAARKKRAHK